jgi:hypothetical protein
MDKRAGLRVVQRQWRSNSSEMANDPGLRVVEQILNNVISTSALYSLLSPDCCLRRQTYDHAKLFVRTNLNHWIRSRSTCA